MGEIAALLSLPNLIWTFVISTVAEAGYVLIGLGLGGAAGDTGAYMHLGYQAAMRGLVLVAGWYLIRRTGSAKTERSGRKRRAHAACGHAVRFRHVFGDGTVAVQGLVLQVHHSVRGHRAGTVACGHRRHARDNRCGGLLHADHSAGLPRAFRPANRTGARAAARHAACLCAYGADGSNQPLARALRAITPRQLLGLPARRRAPI